MRRLDITRDLCPLTFVKTTLELEEMASGELLEILLREGEPLANVSRSLRQDGHEIVEQVCFEGAIWRLIVRAR
jgi:tRNA 2-thiouridine synthesizing protein A